MRRVERTRVERLRQRVLVVGISFALGALADAALTWRLHQYGGGLFPVHEIRTPAAIGTSGEGASPSGPATGGGDAPSAQRKTPAATATSATAPAATSVAADEAIAQLRSRRLEIPVVGIERKDLRDTFTDARGAGGARAHDALDIMAPRNTPVRAVEDGAVAKLFNSEAGGITLYQYDPSGTICYYYAHLERYADGVHEGQMLRRGDILGYVGSTGNAAADAPHLHFAIFRLTPERQWWKGEPINPYPVLK